MRIFPCVYIYIYLGVSKNNGTPKWMVKKMESPIKMDDLGVPQFLETSMCVCVYVYMHASANSKMVVWAAGLDSYNLLTKMILSQAGPKAP